jgi:hypothetical protein
MRHTLMVCATLLRLHNTSVGMALSVARTSRLDLDPTTVLLIRRRCRRRACCVNLHNIILDTPKQSVSQQRDRLPHTASSHASGASTRHTGERLWHSHRCCMPRATLRIGLETYATHADGVCDTTVAAQHLSRHGPFRRPHKSPRPRSVDGSPDPPALPPARALCELAPHHFRHSRAVGIAAARPAAAHGELPCVWCWYQTHGRTPLALAPLLHATRHASHRAKSMYSTR